MQAREFGTILLLFSSIALAVVVSLILAREALSSATGFAAYGRGASGELPDLVVESVERDAGGYLARYCNNGSGAGGSLFSFSFSVAGTPPFHTGKLFEVPSPGSCSWTPRISCSKLGGDCAGSRRITVYADAWGNVAESSEGNNKFSADFIQASSPSQPPVPPEPSNVSQAEVGSPSAIQGPVPSPAGQVEIAEGVAVSNCAFFGGWGSFGGGDSQFSSPLSVATFSDSVYVADTGNNKIKKFFNNGTFRTSWGRFGFLNGTFNKPSGVAVDSSGNVYVADTNNHRIQKFTPNGTFLMAFGSSRSLPGYLYFPIDVAVDSEGYVFVAENKSRITKFTPLGAYVLTWNIPYTLPRGVGAGFDGNVHVTGDFVRKFNSAGRFIASWGSYGSGDGQFKYPSGIHADSYGRVFIADKMNNRIQVFVSDGTFVSKFGAYGTGDGLLKSPNDVSVNSTGFAFVADTDNNRIRVFDCGKLPFSGNLSMTVNVARTGIYVNGSFMGIADPVLKLVMPPGHYRVVAAKAGYFHNISPAAITFNKTTSVSMSLAPVPNGSLLVYNNQLASVYVDGVYRGSFNFLLQDLVPGEHFVRANRTGYQTRFYSVTVVSGQTATLVVGNPYAGTAKFCDLRVGGLMGEKKADIVIGQPDFSKDGCNGDGAWRSYPYPPNASARTLCFLRSGDESPAEGGYFASMAVDAQGNLYVPDFLNNRVLKYDSPFTSDALADEVWGQSSFNNTYCNDGNAAPNESRMCFIHPDAPGAAGVEVDSFGNLWVADTGNNRVLRFPNSSGRVSKSADLVLGQYNFYSSGFGSGLDQLHYPGSVRVNSTGSVFVADTRNGRVLVYDPPLYNGSRGRVFASGLYNPTDVEIDVATPDPSSGGVWVVDWGNHQVLLYSYSGEIKKVLLKDVFTPDGACGSNSVCNSTDGLDWCNLCDNRGSFGITALGDVIMSSSANDQDVSYYRHPIPTPVLGYRYSASAKFGYPPYRRNYLGTRGMESPRGLAVAGNQLVVSDMNRVAFWNLANGTAGLYNFKPADGVVGTQDFETLNYSNYYRISASNDYLWVIGFDSFTIKRFPLPLTHGQMPDMEVNLSEMKFLGTSSPLNKRIWATGIYADPAGRFLWLAMAQHDRVVRLRLPPQPKGDYLIDAIIGGSGIPNENLTWDRHCATPLPPLCVPGTVALDRRGNVFVSDYWTENAGGERFLIFNSSLFPVGNRDLIVATAPSKQFMGAYPWEAAFDSQNRMAIGFAAFTPGGRFPYLYRDIYSKQAMYSYDYVLSELYTQAFAPAFDSYDNLYFADMNYGRVLVYNKPFDTDRVADFVLGQPSFYEGMIKEKTSFKVANPSGVAVDRSVSPNRVFVADGENSRILGYSSLGVCQDNPAKPCTTDLDC